MDLKTLGLQTSDYIHPQIQIAVSDFTVVAQHYGAVLIVMVIIVPLSVSP